MDIADFKEVTESMVILMEKAEEDGDCGIIRCKECPFHLSNSVDGRDCVDNGYASREGEYTGSDTRFTRTAREFIEMFEDEVEFQEDIREVPMEVFNLKKEVNKLRKRMKRFEEILTKEEKND